nr:cilia- and flagella-associated protein 61 isoform X2 [Paramormyrops kingsleyae]
MKTVTSLSGKVETVTVRRTESADALEISGLISPSTVAVFGRVNVLNLLERANFAITLSNSRNEVLAHAAFLDHPSVHLVDQGSWEPWFHEHFRTDKCTPLNSLFMHLFVAQPAFAIGSAKEIVRTVFNAITYLHYIFLVTPSMDMLEPVLTKIFEPIEVIRAPERQCAAFVCHRQPHVPILHVRRARVEDHDDLTAILAERSGALSDRYGPYFLTELIEAQDEDHQAAVCENEGMPVGFMSVSADINLKLLDECFELGPFDGLRRCTPPGPHEPTGVSAERLFLQEPNPQNHPNREAQTNATKAHVSEVYQDAPNAFCIQLFFVDRKYEMRSVDFLPHVFGCFPDHDFCIITVPKTAPELPLLQAFLRVAPRGNSVLPHELYVCHRSGLLRTFQVRVALSSDRPAIETLLETLTLHESILGDLDMFYQARRDPDGTPLQAFLAHTQGQVVGIIIIRNEEDLEYIQSHYDVENFIYFSYHRREEHGRLCHFVLNPIFQCYARHFLKEALRLGQKSCLYYPIYTCSQSPEDAAFPGSSPAVVLSCMVPVRPRRQIFYPLEELSANAPSRQITTERMPYALYHFNRKLTMEPKITINSRIVVVGASDTGISFLEALCFCSHLQFNNLTLISTHGYPGCYTDDNMEFLATSYSSRDHAQISLRSWVNVVEGKMVGLDRVSKHVRVSAGQKVPYDQLVLCTGQQYQVPCPTAAADISQPAPSSQLSSQPRQRYTGPIPSNLFTPNDPTDCQRAYRWLLANFVEQEDNAVVYGNTIDTYTCVEALLRLGVSGSRIHLVQLPANSPVSCFNDPAVEEAVAEVVTEKGITIHRNGQLAQINDGQDPQPITLLSFTTDSDPLRLKCAVFMNFSWKAVDYDAFRVINDAGLVYDSGLVIDTAFHTNDPSIWAAGPLTKFARRHHAGKWTHANFSSKEVGAQLAAALLPFFDPTLEPLASPTEDQDRLVPIYTKAKIQGGRLPAGYSYLHASKATICTPLATQMLSDKHGREMVTGTAGAGSYFRLFVNQYGVVESITCLSLKPIPVSNYLYLYGKHELLLNRLCDRFNEGLIQDFYRYFEEPWCLAIFHDRFADFEEEVRQIMESTKVQGEEGLLSIPDLVQRIADEKLWFSGDPMMYLKNVFEKTDGFSMLKRSLLNYLKYNRYHLTMYAHAGFL